MNTEKEFTEYKILIQNNVLPKYQAENRLLKDEVNDLKRKLVVALDILYLKDHYSEYEDQTEDLSHLDRNLSGVESELQTSSRLINSILKNQALKNTN